MVRSTVSAMALVLSLSACVGGLRAGDPGLYGRLAEGDVELAARLMQNTLENEPDGATRRWLNDTTGSGGAVTPTRTFVDEDGRFCRDYREEIRTAGDEGRFFHTACRSDDARWVWV